MYQSSTWICLIKKTSHLRPIYLTLPPSFLLQVQLKHAMFLEDEGRFRDAEESFIKVGKPREAIDMYVHQQDWAAALRVADLCDPAAMPDILVRS